VLKIFLKFSLSQLYFENNCWKNMWDNLESMKDVCSFDGDVT
jgi:hypothetical protein